MLEPFQPADRSMKNNLPSVTIACFAALTAHSSAATLLAAFHFNNSTAGTLGDPGVFNSSGPTEVYDPGTSTLAPATHGVFASSATIDLSGLAGTMGGIDGDHWGTFGGTLLNAVDGDSTGGALAVQGTANNGRSILLTVSTAGYDQIRLSYVTRGSNLGFTSQTWHVSTDGVNFAHVTTIGGRNTVDWSIQTVDLSAFPELDDRSAVFLRLTFDGAAAVQGNNRVDNLRVESIPEPGMPLLAALGLLSFSRRVRKPACRLGS
jgi:hypothetical protein